MSQLIDTLKRVSGAAPKPMGFGASRTTASAPGIALIAVINPAVLENQVNHLDNADAVLIQSGKSRLTAKNIEKVVETLPSTLWGVSLEDNDGKKISTLIESGCDFFTFPVAGKISDTPTDEKVGRILQVESSIDDGLIRAVNDLAEAYQSLSSAYVEATTLKTDVLPGAQSAFDASREGYRQGKFDYLVLLDSQRTLFEVRARYIEALNLYHKAVADVERLIGKDLDTLTKTFEEMS